MGARAIRGRALGRVAAGVALLLLAGPACAPADPPDPRGAAPPSLSVAARDPSPSPVTTAGPPPPESFSLVATGDVLVHQGRRLVRGATVAGGFDFSGVFAPVAPLIAGADVAICHLETPVAPAGGPFRGYPSFAVQPEIVVALAGAGYDACSTASNHSLDDGFDGLVRTLDSLDAAGLAHAGTYRSEAESVSPRMVEAAGVRVGLVSATFSLNGIALPDGREWSVDVVPVPDVTRMLAAASRARSAGAEVVVASLHCCAEYDHEPTDAQVTAVRTLLASPDVDLVLGHHAHVVQPFERIGAEWVAYGLGNHVAEHSFRTPGTEDSVMARFTFTRGTGGSFTVTRAEAIPLRIRFEPDAVRVVPADPATSARVTAVLDRRGALRDGLVVLAG